MKTPKLGSLVAASLARFAWGTAAAAQEASGPSAEQIALDTIWVVIAGALAVSWMIFGKAYASMTFNGVLPGLVSITAPCAFVGMGSAAIIGLIGGALVMVGIVFIERMGVGDPVEAITVHGVCSVWGTIALGLFAASPWVGGEGLPGIGLLFGGGMVQLGAHIFGTVAACGVAFGVDPEHPRATETALVR
jgi:Amt family ammonium transporter